MKAARVHQFGGTEQIMLEEIEHPEPAEHEVLVQVEACGVGPWDAWVRAGKSVIEQPLPLTLGSDLSGHVAAVGRGVSSFHVGEAVFGVTNPRFTGAYAEYAIANAGMLAAKPAHTTHIEAASVPVVAVTALQMLFDHAKVVAGQRVLIHGAGGSVGAFAVQLARNAGAHVIGTDVAAAIPYVRSLGAEEVVNASTESFERALAPVDVVIDAVGGEVLERSFGVLKPGGVLISSASRPSMARAAERGVRAQFILVDVTTSALERIAALMAAGQLRPHLGPVLALAEARVAHEMLEGTRPRAPGKIVLRVGANADERS